MKHKVTVRASKHANPSSTSTASRGKTAQAPLIAASEFDSGFRLIGQRHTGLADRKCLERSSNWSKDGSHGTLNRSMSERPLEPAHDPLAEVSCYVDCGHLVQVGVADLFGD
jgi:hypothetical protein